ncbi:unnamed protein product [Rotaria sordida]|uniref:Uncharacterized protein n=1 Tax=Rotaria sordida TaxID=392033 RepID=A0A819WE77_9BILA|nr:unnamed protein product [Rotaria sordida]CAF4124072.1 unnamed protein product [Rotaria sordida]
MSYNLQIVARHSPNNTQSIPLYLSGIDQQNFSDIIEFKNHVFTHCYSVYFILLFLDLNDPYWRADLEELRRQHHVFSIIICVKPNCNLIFPGDNVSPVFKEVISYKIKSSVVKFFEVTAEKLKLEHSALAPFFQDKANFFKQQRFASGEIKASHISIFPMNATEENLIDFQERLICLCNNLCGEYELRICTIYDYISSNENIDFSQNPDAAILYDYVKKLSPIRLYLIGNEEKIGNSVSKYFFENESDDGNIDGYYGKPTLVENEPVNESIGRNLANKLGIRRPLTNVTIKQLNQLQDDIKFPDALEEAHLTIQQREMVADIKLRQRATARSESPFEFSASFRMTAQAEYGAMEHNNNVNSEDINNMIQY